ncbi:FAD-dependent oxidoreductase [Actinoplanes sp. TBRC 11911]|uniref:NAD(P)/FAD-dependent oxidoreductase n=1 Tax=Actinoplanes sp. TBRC 11911 TaxID=2729386 RepID=UPI00145E107F|nr:FAD-dependent oxidoreductase [Actinoplanes sp. TBRC 11911]NMO56758.1 FAD-dependent oxidoreductase [Actinoplanes sp. TBRC 11911]
MRVSIIGSGVIGMTVAHELATHGHEVTVISDRDHRASVSSVAAAIWFPYGVGRTDRVMAAAATTFQRLVALADDPATGVRMRSGTVLARTAAPDFSYISGVPVVSGVPDGASGVRCDLPLIVTGVYLGWLRKQLDDRGVRLESRSVSAIDDVTDADAVVVAAGLGSAALVGGDPGLHPVRGQVVRLANPGLTDFVLDDDNPAGLTYVVPRDEDIVCGGTDEPHSWDEHPHGDVEAAILARATALVPALRGLPVVSRAAGLRPARPHVRLELLPARPRPVVACYGHGGSGFTLSWGEAADVRRLLESPAIWPE